MLENKDKEAVLISLFRRIKNRLVFLNNKKYRLIDGLIKERDDEQLKKIREDILK